MFSLCYSNENEEINKNQINYKSNQINIQKNTYNKTINQNENVNQIKAIDTMAYEPDKNANHNKIVIGILCGVAAILLVVGLIYAKQSLDKGFNWNIM
jgi:glycosylphosphatidylinositol transamidase (GPIT) subunit GPI8